MPQKDPRNRPYRVAVYIAYGLIVAWIIVPFVLGGARGVYSQEGLDLLCAGRAATAVCAAIANAAPSVKVDGCPAEAPQGSPDGLLAQAKAHAAEVADPGLRDRLRRALMNAEVLVRGVNDPQAKKRVAEELADFLK